MRPQIDLCLRRACAAMMALSFTYTMFVGGLARADAPPHPGSLTAKLGNRRVLAYGGRVTVEGEQVPGAGATALLLEFRPGDSVVWKVVAATPSGRGGAYRLRVALTRSGVLRVAYGPSASLSRSPVAGGHALALPAGPVSASLAVRVRARVGVGRPALNVLAGQRITVAGALTPARARRQVLLQVKDPHGWRSVARGRTGARGRYRLRYTPHDTGSEPTRVRFGGDADNAPAQRSAGLLNVYRPVQVSWYGGGGVTACGRALTAGTLGVANKTLPCGTLVTLRYGHRSVRVPVIDRGPYVAGRDFDLTEATKNALGFGDTGEVWATRS